MNHTPGPWKIGKKGEITLRIKGPRRPDVGGGWYEPTLASVIGGRSIPIAANSRLIAAAPDLLDALKFALENLLIALMEKKCDWHGYDWESHEQSITKAISAIAKATKVKKDDKNASDCDKK